MDVSEWVRDRRMDALALDVKAATYKHFGPRAWGSAYLTHFMGQLTERNNVDVASILRVAEDRVTDSLSKSVAVLAAVISITDEHYQAQLRRSEKFGREGSECVCEVCKIRQAMETILLTDV